MAPHQNNIGIFDQDAQKTKQKLEDTYFNANENGDFSLDQKKMLLEQRYALNKSQTKWVSVGISPKDLQPLVHINNANKRGPIFTLSDWSEFLSEQPKIISFFNENDGFEVIKLKNHEIFSAVTDADIKMIAIKYDDYTLYLGKISCINLFYVVKTLISCYIKFLYSLNLPKTYSDILLHALSINGDVITNVKNLLQCEIIQHFAIVELLELYPNIIFENVQAMMFPNLSGNLPGVESTYGN